MRRRLDRAAGNERGSVDFCHSFETARAGRENITNADSARVWSSVRFRVQGNGVGGSRRILVEDISAAHGCRAASPRGRRRTIVAMPRRSTSGGVQWGAMARRPGLSGFTSDATNRRMLAQGGGAPRRVATAALRIASRSPNRRWKQAPRRPRGSRSARSGAHAVLRLADVRS